MIHASTLVVIFLATGAAENEGKDSNTLLDFLNNNPWIPDLTSTVLSGVVAIVVGFGGARLGYRSARKIAEIEPDSRRFEAISKYQKAMIDIIFSLHSTYDGGGAHPKPPKDVLEDARNDVFRYLIEFRGHWLYGDLLSPYVESSAHDNRNDLIDFYGKLSDILGQHLRAYPTTPQKLPYECRWFHFWKRYFWSSKWHVIQKFIKRKKKPLKTKQHSIARRAK